LDIHTEFIFFNPAHDIIVVHVKDFTDAAAADTGEVNFDCKVSSFLGISFGFGSKDGVTVFAAKPLAACGSESALMCAITITFWTHVLFYQLQQFLSTPLLWNYC